MRHGCEKAAALPERGDRYSAEVDVNHNVVRPRLGAKLGNRSGTFARIVLRMAAGPASRLGSTEPGDKTGLRLSTT